MLVACESRSFMGDLHMVAVAQLVRVPGCGPGGRRFEPGQPPQSLKDVIVLGAYFLPFFKGKAYYADQRYRIFIKAYRQGMAV